MTWPLALVACVAMASVCVLAHIYVTWRGARAHLGRVDGEVERLSHELEDAKKRLRELSNIMQTNYGGPPNVFSRRAG